MAARRIMKTDDLNNGKGAVKLVPVAARQAAKSGPTLTAPSVNPPAPVGKVETDKNISSAMLDFMARKGTVMAVAEMTPADTVGMDAEIPSDLTVDENNQGTDAVVEGAPEQLSPATANDVLPAATGDEPWRKYITDKQKSDLLELEKKINELRDSVKAGEDKLARQQATLEDAEGGLKKSLESSIKKTQNAINGATTTLENREKAYRGIIDAAIRKYENRKATDEKKAEKNEAAKAENALAKIETYEVKPLTPEQHLRLDELEKEVEAGQGVMADGFMRMSSALIAIRDEGLHHGQPGGFAKYCADRFGIDKYYLTRTVLAGEQATKLSGYLHQKTRALIDGKPAEGELSESELPNTEFQYRELRRFGTTENQYAVWKQAFNEAKEKGKDKPSARDVINIGNAMVATGEISVGMDAEIAKTEKAVKERKAKEGRTYPLNFNRYHMLANAGGHEFDIYSERDDKDNKLFEVRIDGTPVTGPDGQVVRFAAPSSAIALAEQKAAELIKPEWGEGSVSSPGTANDAGEAPKDGDTHAVAEAPAEPAAKPENSGRRGTANESKGKGKAAAQTPALPAGSMRGKWFIGYDEGRGETFQWNDGDGNPDETTGYDRHTGPFDSMKEADDYRAREEQQRAAEA